MARRKVTFEGREVLGEDVQFEIAENTGVALVLADGAKLRLRPVVVSVLKTNEKTPDGEPLYIVQHLVHIGIETLPTGWESQPQDPKKPNTGEPK